MQCNFIVWNIQGIGGEDSLNTLRDLKRSHNPIMVIIVEPRTRDGGANKIIQKLGFANSHRVNTIGFFGGI